MNVITEWLKSLSQFQLVFYFVIIPQWILLIGYGANLDLLNNRIKSLEEKLQWKEHLERMK